MKKLILPFLIINCQLSIINCFAQGTIQVFYTLPASPTVNDEVRVIANLNFTSGGCEAAEQASSTNGARTDAWAIHCPGMLTYICSTTDTFNLGILPSGDHVFVLTLNSGGGPSPCTPGIVPDDTDSLTFTVDPAVGIQLHGAKPADFSIYPNPASSSITINGQLTMDNGQLKIMNAQGQLVTSSVVEKQSSINIPIAIGKQLSIDVSTLNNGLYYLTLQTEQGVATKKFEIVR